MLTLGFLLPAAILEREEREERKREKKGGLENEPDGLTSRLTASCRKRERKTGRERKREKGRERKGGQR